MVISVAKKIGKSQVGVLAVVSLAIGNGVGRIMAGVVSDKIGRRATLCMFFTLQAVTVFLIALSAKAGSALGGATVLVILSAMVGANYGANLAIFPSITKDFYGLKHFGVNYGLVFTAWGIGGFMLAMLAGKVYDKTGSFNFAFYCSVALLILAAIVAPALKPPKSHEG